MLEVKNLSAFYGNKKVLDNINLCFETGNFYAVVGKNGSGKSTLASCLCGLMKYSGDVLVDDVNLHMYSDNDRAKVISILPQDSPSVPFTSGELAGFGRNSFGESHSVIEKKAFSALEQVGISHLFDKRVDKISGGERRLSYFAMNLCQDANILILDEPTSNLDLEHENNLLSAAKELCKNGKTVICIIHDLALAVKFSDRIIILEDGMCTFSLDTRECLRQNVIEKTFGVKRFEADGEMFFQYNKNRS